MDEPCRINTLRFDADLCNGCGMCTNVCPHGVYQKNGRANDLVRPERCMECGACQLNCPTGAIEVDSGVGCAYALMLESLTGKAACCGPRGSSSCC